MSKSIQRLFNRVKNNASLQEPKAYINPEMCNYLNTDLLMRCPACFDIFRFSLNFQFRHLECHIFLSYYFKMHAPRRGGIFFTLCPFIREEVRPKVVIIA